MIQGWSMWSFIVARSWGDAVERKMKVTSWEVVVVVVIAIVGDGREVVAIVTESGVIGSSGITHSMLFDAHIIFMFDRQYHINCLSIQKHT